jgi:curlin associated repeat protein
MQRARTTFVVLLSSMALLATARAAGIDQNGDYLYTITRDNGFGSRTHTRSVNPRAMETLSARMSEKMTRLQQSYEARAARGLGCASSGVFADQTTLDQSGSGNFASMAQLGSNDSAAVSQTGTGDTAYALQLGDAQQTTISQRGNHDLAVVIQRCRPAPGWMRGAREGFGSPFGERSYSEE